MEYLTDHLALAGGLAAILVGMIAWWGDRRRLHRRDPDRVGIMPWTGLFFWAVLFASVLLLMALQEWLARP